MKHLKKLLSIATTAILSLQLASAAELGMEAPTLNIANYIKGGPVDLSQGKGKNVYVVEFWATWCGPCRQTIPHLTELQKKFRDQHVTFIGITDEDVETVEPYVAKMGDKMDYVVALDDNQKTAMNYMAAFEQSGIPTAFIVDRAGKVVWFGHPLTDMEPILEKVVAGEFDVEAYKAEQKALQLLIRDMVAYLQQTAAETYSDNAKEDGRKFVDGCDKAAALDQFAWTILVHPQIKHRDLNLAITAAKKAWDLTDGKNPSVAETYAKALFNSGDKAKAIDLQKQAIAIAPNDKARKAFEETLKEYEASK